MPIWNLLGRAPLKLEQVRRIAEDKNFGHEEAERDFGFSPRTFREGIRSEVRLWRETSRMSRMRRTVDILGALGGLLVLGPFLLCIALLIKLTSNGPVLHWSNRIGVDNIVFSMPKFRTMRTNAPVVATHLLTEPERYLTPIGRLLRKFSLDELPQLVTILKGDITFGRTPAGSLQSTRPDRTEDGEGNPLTGSRIDRLGAGQWSRQPDDSGKGRVRRVLHASSLAAS